MNPSDTLRHRMRQRIVRVALAATLLSLWAAGTAAASATPSAHAAPVPASLGHSGATPSASAHHPASARQTSSRRVTAIRYGIDQGSSQAGHFMSAGIHPLDTTLTCDTSWKSAVSGSWYDSSKWTNGVPEVIGSNAPSESACITVPGTYTVTAAGDCPSTFCPGQGDVVPAATALTLGSSSGTQTLVVESAFSDQFCDAQDGNLTITGDANVDPNGRLNLVAGTGSCSNNGNSVPLNNTARLSVGGTLTDSGLLQTYRGSSTAPNVFLSGNLTNSGGAINVNFSLFYNDGNNSPLTLDNAGRIHLADGTFLGDSGQNFMADTTIINDTGGSIVNSGDSNAGVVRVSPFGNNVFDQGAGTTTPSGPHPASPAVVVNGTPLTYTGTGASSIQVEGGATLTGNLASGQNLTMETNSGIGQTVVNANASFTNAGNITQTEVQGPGCGSCFETFSIAGTLTNTGILEFDPGTGAAINRFLNGNITNAGGTININTNTQYNAGNSNSLTLDNAGTIRLADGALFGDTGGNSMGDTTIVNDTGGSIVNSGHSNAGFVNVNSDSGTNVFEQGAGTTSPSVADPSQPAVAVHGTTLDYTGTGASTIDLLLGNDTLEGDLAPHQNLVFEQVDDCGSGPPPAASTPDSLTNAGTITFRSNSNCLGNGNDPLQPSLNVGGGGILTNTGTISSLVPAVQQGNPPGPGGTAAINGTLTNNGMVSVPSGDVLTLNGALTNYDGPSGTLTGGSYLLSGTFRDDDNSLTFQGIVNDASKVTLNGGSFLDNNGVNALRNLASVAAKSLLMLSNGVSFSTPGSLTNAGTISTAAGTKITVNGNYGQTSAGIWSTGVSSATSFGKIIATGTGSLAGTLILSTHNLSLPVGTSFFPFSSSSLSGSFSNITGTAISGGDFLVIQYTARAFKLTVEAPQITPNPTSGAPGDSFTVSGSGFSPRETVSIFMGGRTLTPAVADANGSISQTETVPPLAAGSYTITAKGHTSFVKVTAPFNIT